MELRPKFVEHHWQAIYRDKIKIYVNYNIDQTSNTLVVLIGCFWRSVSACKNLADASCQSCLIFMIEINLLKKNENNVSNLCWRYQRITEEWTTIGEECSFYQKNKREGCFFGIEMEPSQIK